MLVEATRTGYYNLKRVYAGTIFELKTVRGKDKLGKPITLKPEDQFSHQWMKKVDESGGYHQEDEAPVKRARRGKIPSSEIIQDEESVI